MGMEALKGVAMTYQGSASAAVKEESRPQQQPVVSENQSATAAPTATANRTVVAESNEQDSKGSRQQSAEQGNAQLRKAVEDINKKMLHNSEAIFGIHEGTNRVTIKIVDKESKKVLKEIPPEKTLDMIAKVWELAGIMVDEKM